MCEMRGPRVYGTHPSTMSGAWPERGLGFSVRNVADETGKNLRPTIGQIMAGGIMKQNNLGKRDFIRSICSPSVAHAERASHTGQRLKIP
jgi:hypothetical protein